jgi:hypothetical protein
MEKQIYQINISLTGFKPKIWRRAIINADILLPDLHEALQIIM